MQQFIGGREVNNPHEAIRLFSLCSAMQWNHLPVAGGIYDQHPKLIDLWQIIFGEQARKDANEHAKQKAELDRAKARRR